VPYKRLNYDTNKTKLNSKESLRSRIIHKVSPVGTYIHWGGTNNVTVALTLISLDLSITGAELMKCPAFFSFCQDHAVNFAHKFCGELRTLSHATPNKWPQYVLHEL